MNLLLKIDNLSFRQLQHAPMDGINAKITTIGLIQGCVLVSVYADVPPTTSLTKMNANASATEGAPMATV